MEARAARGAVASSPAALARVAALACAVLLLGFGFLALAQYGSEAGMGAAEAAAAGDGPITASGEIGRIFVDTTHATTALYLRGSGDLEFRLHGDVSGSYAPGDYVRVDGNKTGSVVEGRAIRHAPSPWAAAAPAIAGGAALAAGLVADQVVPRLSGRGGALFGLFGKLRMPKLARRRESDDETASEFE